MIAKNTLKILGFLLKNPTEQYNVNQVARILKLSVGSAHKILKGLEKKRIVKTNKLGNAIYYSLDLADKETRRLSEIVLMENKNKALSLNPIARVYVKELERFKDKVKALVLFGSILTKKEKANDIDVLFIIKDKKEVKKILDFCLEISKTKTKPVIPLIMTENDLKAKIKEKDQVILEIIRTGIILEWEEIIIKTIENGKS